MQKIQVRWTSLLKAINRLAPRERLLIIITTQVLLVMLFYLVITGPLLKLNQGAAKKLQDEKSQISDLLQQSEALKEAAAHDPNLALRDEIRAQQERLSEQQQQISGITQSLIKPQVMGDVLGGLVQGKSLRLQQLRNAPVSVVQVPGQEPGINLLFRHDLSLTLQGSFNAALSYIESIEQQPWQLFWQSMSLRTDQYPEGTLQLQVHTLSTSENVLGF